MRQGVGSQGRTSLDGKGSPDDGFRHRMGDGFHEKGTLGRVHSKPAGGKLDLTHGFSSFGIGPTYSARWGGRFRPHPYYRPLTSAA